MLRMTDLSLRYGRNLLIDGVSYAFAPGTVVGLVAPNGAGKTTLMRALACLPGARPSGSISVDDIPAADETAFRRRVFYAPEAHVLLYPDLTVRAHLRMARDLWGSGRDLTETSRACGIDGFLGKRVRSLSQGMRQQAALAVSYLTGARYLLLDEPMNALDPTNVARHTRLLRERASAGDCVVLSSHILDNVDRVADTILFIKDGKLAEHDARGGISSREMYERLYTRA